jgi:hypothetical protein
MLGGDEGRTLVASVAPTYDEAEATANHRAATLVTEVEMPHAGFVLEARKRPTLPHMRRGSRRRPTPAWSANKK